MQQIAVRQRLAAEFIGTAGLLAVVVGSGIMGEMLAGGNTAIALLANALATGAILVVLITTLGPLSGAHFNPAVTLAFFLRREIAPRDAAYYLVAQVLGGIVGTLAAHVMFDLPPLQFAETARNGFAQWFSEAVATFGLVGTILATMRYRPEAVGLMVGLFIVAGYWFTASTSFANPAVTIARSVTDTFSGIAPADAPAFIVAQLLGAVAATLLAGWLFPVATGSEDTATQALD
ncbi:MAG: MIP/aquaporin family protein [Thiohalocapsa sp.]